jgi:hypothetical protein
VKISGLRAAFGSPSQVQWTADETHVLYGPVTSATVEGRELSLGLPRQITCH